jgi:hypothetical protein
MVARPVPHGAAARHSENEVVPKNRPAAIAAGLERYRYFLRGSSAGLTKVMAHYAAQMTLLKPASS